MRSVRTVSLGLALLVAGQNGGWAQETAALETAAQDTPAQEGLRFSPEGEAWLQEGHTVRVRVGDNPPNFFFENGEPAGIVIDFLDAIAERTGIDFQYVFPSPPLPEDLQGLIQGTGPDVLPYLEDLPERRGEILFTQSFITSPRFLFSQREAPRFSSLEELSGRTVAAVRGEQDTRILTRDHPEIRLLLVDEVQEAMEAVSLGQAFAMVADLRLGSNLISARGFQNLKVNAPSSLPDVVVSMGIRPDWPELRDIVDKALDAIPASEKAEIASRWPSARTEVLVQVNRIRKWGFWIGVGVVLTLLLAGFWIMQLVRRIRRRVADLTESEERYRALFEGSQNGILFADVETNQFKYANPAISEILGYSREELCGMSVIDIHPPESQQMVVEAFESQFRGLGRTAFGLPCLRKDGAVIKCDVSGGSLSTPEGMFRIGFFTDVTERLKAEEEAMKQTLRLKLATEATQIATWDWDLVTDDLYFSPEWKGQLGYEDNELPNHFQEWKSRLHPDDLEETLRAVEDYLAGKRPDYNVEFRLRHKDGSYRWIYTRADKVLDDDGNLTRIFGCHVDVTQRRETEAALRASETHFRDVVEQSPVSIQIHAPDGSLIQSNPAFSKLYALSPEVYKELKEKYNVLQDEQAVELGVMPYIKKAFEGEAVLFPSFEYHGTDTLKTLDLENPVSRTCWLRTYGFPLKAENGEVKSVVFWSEDITDQKHAEDEVARYQERLRALAAELTMAEERERSRLASDLHDEVGQALALARIQLGVAIKTGGASELRPILEDVSKTVLNASRETRRLVSDLSSPAIRELGLGAAISEWMADRFGDGFQPFTEFHDDLDPSRNEALSEDQKAILFRNLRELLTNVIKHAKAEKVTVRLDSEGSNVRLTIQDDGVGFDPQALPRLATDEGGFGLFSVQERMADLGGSLEIDSSPGAGCTALLTLPVEPN